MTAPHDASTLAQHLRDLAAQLVAAAEEAATRDDPAALDTLAATVSWLDEDVPRTCAAARGAYSGTPPTRDREELDALTGELAATHEQLRHLRAAVDYVCMSPWDRERTPTEMLEVLHDDEDRARVEELLDLVPDARRVPSLDASHAQALTS